MALGIGEVSTDRPEQREAKSKMPNIASYFRDKKFQESRIQTTAKTSGDVASRGRRIVALVGQGKGPVVAFRAEQVCVKISGLIEGGQLVISIDDKTHKFDRDGVYEVLGGEFAQVRNCDNTSPVICELLIGG